MKYTYKMRIPAGTTTSLQVPVIVFLFIISFVWSAKLSSFTVMQGLFDGPKRASSSWQTLVASYPFFLLGSYNDTVWQFFSSEYSFLSKFTFGGNLRIAERPSFS